MIFTTVVRTFIRAGVRASADLAAFAKRYIEQGTDVEPVHIHAYTMLESAFRQSPISLEFAAKFIEELDGVMEKILSGTSHWDPTDGEQTNRTDLENKLFLESVIPRPIRKAIYTVTDRLIGAQSPLDIPAVIFSDTMWLGFSDIRPPAAPYVNPPPNIILWDTLRKQRLSPGKVRKCNRCGILSALDDPPVVNDLVRKIPAAPGQAPPRSWTVLLMRNCLCFGSWSVVEFEQ